MKFDNKKTTIRVYLWKMILAIFFAIAIIFFLGSKWFNKPFHGLERSHLIVIAASLYLFIIIFVFFLDLNYFYFSDDTDRIILRYYPIRPLGRKKRAIEIPKIALAKFYVKKSFFGLKKSLILYQKVKKNVAKYPPIGITALSKAEQDILEKQLGKYVRP
ncbi:MAG: hypothetical protein AMS27_05915 [Bacteroides sp. SM23_62_1]|nr:MAG: hypothetical protein AMS27_05915 [Bacteroides sp. SM23_62_1]